MAKLLSKQGIQNFSESFLSTIDRERKLAQNREQFQQQMAFRNRQLDFLSVYRQSLIEQGDTRLGINQGNLDARNREQDFRELPVEPKPIKQLLRTERGGGVISDFFGFDVGTDEEDIVTSINRRNLPKGTEDKEKIPFFDLSKSGDAFREFRNLQSGTPLAVNEGEEGKFNVTLNNKLTEVSQSEIEELKRQKIREIEDNTNNEARRINSTVPGFFDAFQAFFRKIKSPEEINSVVSKELKDMSSTTIDAMKTLLKRRIFK